LKRHGETLVLRDPQQGKNVLPHFSIADFSHILGSEQTLGHLQITIGRTAGVRTELPNPGVVLDDFNGRSKLHFDDLVATFIILSRSLEVVKLPNTQLFC